MADPVAWPSSLEFWAEHGSWAEEKEPNVVRFDPEVGPSKTRRRSYLPGYRVQWTRVIDSNELESFLDFYDQVLISGVKRFTAEDPRTQESHIFQFIAEPTWTDIGPGYWRLRFSFRKQPREIPYVLLAPFDGQHEATSAPDFSALGHTLTFQGNAYLDAVIKKAGSASLYLGGSGGRVDVSDPTVFNFSDQPFTMHTWFRPEGFGLADQPILGRWLTAGNQRSFLLSVQDALTTPRLGFSWSSNGTSVTNLQSGVSTVLVDTFQHAAVTRDNEGTIRLFLNGVLAASEFQPSGNFNSSAGLAIGAFHDASTDFWYGHIDELVIIKGKALWTNSFTPPGT